MSQCEDRTKDGQCVYVEGHSGDHLFPTEPRDYSDDIRLKVVKDGCERRIAEAVEAALAKREAELDDPYVPFPEPKVIRTIKYVKLEESDRRVEAARREEREAIAVFVLNQMQHYHDEACTLTMGVTLDCIAAAIRARSTASGKQAESVGPTETLLRPPNDKPPEGCYCKPGRCMAPVIMGRQQPCLDPAKASLCPHCALPQMNCDCMPARSTTSGKPAEPVGPTDKKS